MNRNEYSHVAAEISFLEGMASQPGISFLTAKSVESRLRQAKENLAKLQATRIEPVKAILTYRGRPVHGTFGIVADFGATATRAFSDAVTAVAASLSGNLADKGPIPNKSDNQLLITGTALGSFGFVLEEAPSEQMTLDGNTPVAQALELIVDLLDASTRGDEELSESVSKLADRAIQSVSDFLAQLADNHASCALETREKQFRFANVEQVQASRARFSPENIKESDEDYTGYFSGTLPSRRTFEFTTADGETICGTLSKSIEDPSVINQHLGKPVTITAKTRTVGSSKPRYTLAELPW